MAKKKTVKKTITTVTTEEVVANKTQIVCILDASSSMNSIIDEARDGFNKFINDQKKLDGEASLTVATFSSGGVDNGYQLLYDDKPINEVENLTNKDWYGNGMTALYDAIGKTITDVRLSHKSLKKKERPDRVLVAIVTDGEENASREFNQSSVKSLINKMESKDWQFVYLAADQNASLAATSIGVSAGNSLKYTNTAIGNSVVFDTLSMATTNYRVMSNEVIGYASASLMSDITNGSGEVSENLINNKK